MRVNVGQAKRDLSKLFARVEAGDDVEIARDGIPVARLVRIEPPTPSAEQRPHAAMETLYPGSSSIQRRFDLQVAELDGAGGTESTGPLAVDSWEVDHASGAPALAVRIRLGGHTFGYSGDTAWTAALIEAARDCDVFACEAYTYDRPVRYHLDYRTLREHADQLRTKQLILTHLGPSMLDRLGEIDEETAFDGLALRT